MKLLRKRLFPGQMTQQISQREKKHAALVREAASECFVLLKNENGALPLSCNSKIGLYGSGAVKTIKGGTGSGDVNERESVSIRCGLENAGFEITSNSWLDKYDELYTAARLRWRDEINRLAEEDSQMRFFMIYATHPFLIPSGPAIDETLAKGDGADTAIFVISRIAGEGMDRKIEKGDYYLSDEEEVQLKQVCRCYSNVILIINSGGIIDLGFVDSFQNISAILYMGQAGQEGGNALADVILGKVTPSGKLTDTWAEHYEDYPSSACIHGLDGKITTEEYREGIYVGYRYFDTFEVPVRYGFGFGLSYTSFVISSPEISVYDQSVTLKARIRNTGCDFSGKEVLQIYVSCPQGKLNKEYRRLCGFRKTALLAPGQEQELSVSFPLYAMASYDEEESGYLLEKGAYGIWIGNCLESSSLCGSVVIEETKVIAHCEHICPLRKKLVEISPDGLMLSDRKEKDSIILNNLQKIIIDAGSISSDAIVYTDSHSNPDNEVERLVENMDTEMLIRFATGEPALGQGSALGSAGQTVPGAAAETTPCAAAEPWNVASIVLADGPAGLRLKQHYQVYNGVVVNGEFKENLEHGFFAEPKHIVGAEDHYQFCTSMPVGSLLSQSWNTELLSAMGNMIGKEMIDFEVTLWLAPGINIHRNPICGRNFEYYSEDPLLAGLCAAAITKGVQSNPGCGTTIKHFACNNSEENRMGSDSVISERALREIYLKNFEIAIRMSQPMSVMTSYNMINGVHTANSYDLCTKVARDEWGFRGAIMTDWTTTTNSTEGECTATGCILAGNDMVMPGDPADHANLRESLENGSLSKEALKQCVCRTIRLCMASNQYENAEIY